MKKLKALFAVVLSLAMICSMATVAFATNLDYTNEIEVSAVVSPAEVAPGDTVTVSFYFKDTAAADGFIELTSGGTIGYNFTYDTSVVTKTGATAGYGLSSKDFSDKTADTMYIMVEPAATLNITETEAVATVTFTVNADVADGSYDIIKSITDPYIGDLEGMEPDSYITNLGKLNVKGSTPEPTKYTVKFVDGEKEVSSVEYEEGATIVAPADPTPATGKAFDGWYNGEEKFAEGTTATANVTYTAKYVDVAADAPATAVKSEGYEDAAGYTNVWVGRYTATPAANTVLKTFGVAYGEKTFDKENLVEGGATVEFSVALVGVPTDVTLKGAPFATADWAK